MLIFFDSLPYAVKWEEPFKSDPIRNSMLFKYSMLKQILPLILLLFAFQTSFAESEHQFLCDKVIFGEQLPLRLIEIDPQFVKECGDLCAREQVVRSTDSQNLKSIPKKWMKTQIEFNSHLLKDFVKPKKETTQFQPIKRTVLIDPSKKVHLLETRYVYYPYHSNFSLLLKCDSSKNCSGDFENQQPDSKKMSIVLDKQTLEDSRPEAKEIRAEMVFGTREKSRLIIRIFKENITQNSKLNIPTSSSAETTLSPSRAQVEIDVGADEQLRIYDKPDGPVFKRIAAAELKLVCRKVKNQ